MRVLALVTEAFGAAGGIAEYNCQLLRSLASIGRVSDAVVLPRRAWLPVRDLPLGVRQSRPRSGRLAYSLLAFRTAAAMHPVDLIFCGHLYMAPLAAAIAQLARAPLWIHMHGLEAWAPLSQLYRRAVETAALISADSRYTRRRLLEWTDLASTDVRILPCTVDPRFWPGPKPAYIMDRHQLRGRRVLMTVSRLDTTERYKGQDRVISVLPQLLRDHPEIIYLVVGDGSDRPRLEALAAELGVKSNVCFAGFVPANELPDYFRVPDVYVMPSTGEGFGIVFLEAMASGVATIGGNRDGSVDALGDGSLGITIDPDNAEELAAAIRLSLDHPSVDPMLVGRFSNQFFAQHIDRLLSLSLASGSNHTVSEARIATKGLRQI